MKRKNRFLLNFKYNSFFHLVLFSCIFVMCWFCCCYYYRWKRRFMVEMLCYIVNINPVMSYFDYPADNMNLHVLYFSTNHYLICAKNSEKLDAFFFSVFLLPLVLYPHHHHHHFLFLFLFLFTFFFRFLSTDALGCASLNICLFLLVAAFFGALWINGESK